jgi:hypothetical protein
MVRARVNGVRAGVRLDLRTTWRLRRSLRSKPGRGLAGGLATVAAGALP